MFRTSDEWIGEYEARGAWWLHDGNAKRPHALLTSGLHSNGFFNSELVMEDPSILDEAVADLLDLLKLQGLFINDLERVVGPAMGAITLAHDVARHIGKGRGFSCFRSYAEYDGEGETRRMSFKKTAVREKERVLLVEDVLTTGRSVELAAEAVHVAGGFVLPYVGVLVNRSGLGLVGKEQIMRVVSLITQDMPTWTAEECPLCKQGSEALRPKGIENWTRLNGDYPS